MPKAQLIAKLKNILEGVQRVPPFCLAVQLVNNSTYKDIRFCLASHYMI